MQEVIMKSLFQYINIVYLEECDFKNKPILWHLSHLQIQKQKYVHMLQMQTPKKAAKETHKT